MNNKLKKAVKLSILLLSISATLVFWSKSSGFRKDTTPDIKRGQDEHENTSMPKLPIESQQIITKGEYKGHKWYIDKNHLMWWDDKHYIPFSINQIWIDYDLYPKSRFAQHYNYIDFLTNRLTQKGESYFVLFLTHPQIHELSDLLKPSIEAKFKEEWKKFAPAVAKDGLRAMTFYNEINILPISSPKNIHEYKRILNQYAKNMKEIVGNVPVILKIAFDWNVDATMAAVQGDYIDGIGGDFFSSEPDISLKRQMQKPIALLNQSSKTKLFWITEFSRIAGKEPNLYWPAFTSKNHMRRFLDTFVSYGATGFFYFDLNMDESGWKNSQGFAQVTPETAKWFRELQPEITKKILSSTVKKSEIKIEKTKVAAESEDF